MISLKSGAATAHAISSLRAASDLLTAARGEVSAVSVSGVLPESDEGSLPVLDVAQRVAAEHGLAVNVTVDDGRFVVQFRRGAQDRSAAILEAG